MKSLNPISLLLLIFFTCIYTQSSGQEKVDVPFDETHWTINSDEYKFESYNGAKSMYLPKGFSELKGVDFHNGIIEFDIAFPQGRGFPGINFRVQDTENSEEFYMRPHQSGNPDANQYTPIFNGLAGWQLYYGEGHAAAINYKFDDWNHVKLIISGTTGEVYINDMENPLFQIYELKHGDISGSILLKGDAKSNYANFSYTLTDAPELKLPAKDLPSLEPNVITNFHVSNAVEDAAIIAKSSLDTKELPDLSWTDLTCEFTGNLNIARVVKREERKNTALVKISLSSETEQVKRLEFGYSDIAQVFVNGKAVYLGNNTFRSRDYRYLGTVGYFDSVFLELKKGDNEIIIAVMEGFGGWGMRARFDNMEGVTVK